MLRKLLYWWLGRAGGEDGAAAVEEPDPDGASGRS